MSSEERVRRVQFHGRVQFKTIRHVADFSDEEIQEGWYRKKDFQRMTSEVGEIADLVSEGKETHNGEEISIRGLEHLVEEDVADYRAEKMIASIDAVLDEQDDQRDDEINDPETIAKLYTEIATPLLREAYLVGLRDAKEAQLAAQTMEEYVQPEMQPQSQPEAQASPEKPPPPPIKRNKSKESPSMKTKKKKDSKAPAAPTAPKRVSSKSKKASASLKKPVSRAAAPLSAKAAVPIAPKRFPSNHSMEGTELINFKEEDKSDPSEVKKPMTKEERKAAAERRKNSDRRGKVSESSPLVRRRDGSFAFRNKDLEGAKAALKKERRDCVKDSLFKFLDSPDPSFGI